MLISLCGKMIESQFIRMFPPPRSVPSVQTDLSMVPMPAESLEKSVAEADNPVRGGPLYCDGGGLDVLAKAVGITVMVSAVRSATRKMLYLLSMFFTTKFPLPDTRESWLSLCTNSVDS